MNEVSLQPMTREMCHEFYKGFQNDPAIFMDMSQFAEYEYIPDCCAACDEGIIQLEYV